MLERFYIILHHPRYVALRRWGVFWLFFVALGLVGLHVARWEEDFSGACPLHLVLYAISGVGLAGLPVLVWLRERKAWKQWRLAQAQGRMLRLQRGWWDMWLLGLVAIGTQGLVAWYDMRTEARSELQFSCRGPHGDYRFARAMSRGSGAPAPEIGERLPALAPHLHTLYLPDGDYDVHCSTGTQAFYISLNRKAYSFTLRLKPEAGQGPLQYRSCRLRSDDARFRVMHQLERGATYGHWLQELPFEPCAAEDDRYLSYGDYAFLIFPAGAEPTEENARLFYISLQP